MNIRPVLFSMLAVLLVGCAGSGDSPPKMAGIWLGAAQLGGDPQALHLGFDQDGPQLTGSAILQTSDDTIVEGTLVGSVDGNRVRATADFGGSVGTRVFDGRITLGRLYIGSVSGGSFQVAKTTQQILDLRGSWHGTASSEGVTGDLEMVIDQQAGAIARGTMLLDLPAGTDPAGPVVLLGMSGRQSGETDEFEVDLDVSQNRITGTVVAKDTGTEFDIVLNRD